MRRSVSCKIEQYTDVYIPYIRTILFIRKIRIVAAVEGVLDHVGSVVETSVKHFKYTVTEYTERLRILTV